MHPWEGTAHICTYIYMYNIYIYIYYTYMYNIYIYMLYIYVQYIYIYIIHICIHIYYVFLEKSMQALTGRVASHKLRAAVHAGLSANSGRSTSP